MSLPVTLEKSIEARAKIIVRRLICRRGLCLVSCIEVQSRKLESSRLVCDQRRGQIQVGYDVEEFLFAFGRGRVAQQQLPDAAVDHLPLLSCDHRISGLLDSVVRKAIRDN